MTILAVYREFGSLLRPDYARLPDGLTLDQLRGRVRSLPRDFDSRGVICINGRVAPRALWSAIRPKPVAHGVAVEVTFHAPPMGGGEEGGKSILAIVAGIALTALTGFVAGGGLATRLGFSARLFGAGSIGATLAAAGVSLAGSLLISSLVPPPTIKTGKQIVNPGAASAEGNVLEPNGAIPRVIGERKVYPPLACEPLTYFSGGDEVVEAIYVLAGPHRIEDIRVGAAPITTLTDVDYEVRQGFPGDARVTLVTRQSRTDAPQTELRGHTVEASDGRTLESATGDFASALPQRMTVATRDAPDEQLLHLIWSGGLHRNASETDRIRVPIRVRIRQIGDVDWISLPELHFQAANIRQLRATIKLIWTADASTSPSVAGTEGWVEARIANPGQTDAPATVAFAANAYFNSGSGDDYLASSNLGSTRVAHLLLDRYTAAVYLDTAVFPKGRYEIELQRGAQFRSTNYAATAYTLSGNVRDLFQYEGSTRKIPETRDGISDAVYLLRSVSIWNEHPLPTDDLAVVAIRARNRQMEAVSCLAGGWVKDWDGAGWATWAVTDNPAPHLRDIFFGAQNFDPVPADVLDNAGLVAWRTACDTLHYRCNALIEDQSVDDAARIVASCGYAKPYMSEIWGVTRDYDRSAEAPVQMFTPRNSSGFQYTRAFARVPDGFRVNFRDAARDYDSRQITVFRPGQSNESGRLEQVTYEGMVREDDVRARAGYDQAQADRRATFYSLEAAAEAIVCRRGSLVAVQHDMLSGHSGAGRVVDITYNSGGNITALRLDGEVPIISMGDVLGNANLLAEPDILALGVRTGAAIRRAANITVHELSNITGSSDLITFTSPIAATGIAEDVLVAIGPLAAETLRLIVFSIAPKPDLTATLTLVDEAPGIVPLLAA